MNDMYVSHVKLNRLKIFAIVIPKEGFALHNNFNFLFWLKNHLIFSKKNPPFREIKWFLAKIKN